MSNAAIAFEDARIKEIVSVSVRADCSHVATRSWLVGTGEGVVDDNGASRSTVLPDELVVELSWKLSEEVRGRWKTEIPIQLRAQHVVVLAEVAIEGRHSVCGVGVGWNMWRSAFCVALR